MDQAWCLSCRGLTLRCPLPFLPSDDRDSEMKDPVCFTREVADVQASAAAGCSYCDLIYNTMLFHFDASEKVYIRLWQAGGTDLLDDWGSAVQFFCPPGKYRRKTTFRHSLLF